MLEKFLGRNIFSIPLLIIALAAISACDLINPEEEIPAYIYLEEIMLDTQSIQGSSSSRITEIWFYAGGEFLGAYAPPAKIPVLHSGPSEIVLFPGIKLNGIINTPDIYPFFDTILINLNLTPLKVDTIHPVFTPKNNIRYAMIEDFEQNHIFIDEIDGNPSTRIESSQTDVFEGEYSGRLMLSGENDFCEAATLVKFAQLPTNGSPVYLELNYKNTLQFSVGLIGHKSGISPAKNYIISILPRDFWNKIYIDLSPALNVSELDAYQVVIGASLQEGETEGQVFLDNIKLLHFQ